MADPSPSADNSDPNPDIKQNTIGDRNQTIGQVLDSIIIYYTVTNKYYAVDANSSTRKTKNPQIGANPYQGLSAFQETDGDRFFGRDSEIKKLWNKFRDLHKDGSATRLLTIYGPSGSGKSSLVRAGLIPELAREPLSGREYTRVAVLVPGTRPLEALGLVLARIATNDDSPVEKGAEFKRVLEAKNKDGRYEGLCQIANALPKIESQPLIVVVDQLEELFTLCKDPAEREAFIDNLLYATADRSKRVAAIVTLSSDFLGKAQQYSLDKLILDNGLLVMAMDEDELRKAIEEPAKLEWDLTTLKWKPPAVERHLLDAGTVTLLIDQTKGREGALPLLQFALEQIWVGLQEGDTPAKTLETIGGVTGALAGKAQRIYDSLESTEQKIARRVFLGLVQLGEGVKDTRRRTELSRLISHRDSLDQLRDVIGEFAHPDERLITLSNNGREDNKREETAEVTHEALFENWQQLRDWLEYSRSDLRFQRRLDEAAMIWKDHGKPEGNLWRSPNLDLLRDFHERAGNDLTPLQLEFFQDSIDAENAQKQADKDLAQANLTAAERERDLAQANLTAAETGKKLAESKLREEEKKKQYRRLEVIGLAFAIGMFVFIISSMYLSYQNSLLDKRNVVLDNTSKDLGRQRNDLYNQYAYCPKEKGRPGEKIETTKPGKDVCFRNIITSGEVGVFLSSTNFHLDRGIEAFKKQDYKTAIRLFEQAIAGDRSDPVPLIFLNNARARQRYQKLKIEPLKLAVVASIDYYEEAAKEVLRGVADAQDRFNKEIGDKTPLLEIVIANDENEKAAAKKVAEELVQKDRKILGIIGHHSSESTSAALEIYKKIGIAVISPSSTSSALTGKQFFRTVGDTKKIAKKYVDYIKKISNSNNKAIVFYTEGSEYSESLLHDFTNEFSQKEGQVIEIIDASSMLSIAEKIKEISRNDKTKNLLIFSSVRTNSVAIAIAKVNADEKLNLNLLGAMSLSEQETINRGGNSVNGMYL
jgi:ABC-type branched-subunit amino acid transport system substrate-binding protein